MDVLLHDFSGHPFQAELARRLAAKGHRVRHLSSAEYVSGKGHLSVRTGDPATLTFDTVSVGRPFDKYSPRRRIAWELDYGAAAAEKLVDRPDVVIMCNVPLVAMARFVRQAHRLDLPWLFWHQDIYSAGMAEEVRRKLPAPLAMVGARAFEQLERHCARRAGHVVAIGELFRGVYDQWNLDPARVSVIPNWAPLEDIALVDRDNPHTPIIFPGDPSPLRLLYAGTLGRKHNPMLLLDLLRQSRAAGIDAVLTVVSEGDAAEDLRAAAEADPSLPLRVVGFQPAAALSETLRSADVLVGLLEPDASAFSIPSKMLTYMAAGRPILGLMPASNPVAADTAACGGFVADPTVDGVEKSVQWLSGPASDSGERADIGRRTRKLAEERFDPNRITAQFEAVLQRIV